MKKRFFNKKKKKELQCPLESAGRLLTSKVPTVREQATLADVEKLLKTKADKFDSISYIYVLDGRDRLKGAISIKDIYRFDSSQPVSLNMAKDLVSARVHTDQERVALLALEHNIKAVPVVDKQDHFLGVVTSDTILNVLHSESVEDALRIAGAGKLDDPAVNIIKAGTWLHLRKRLPWLILGLAGGIAAAFIVQIFEKILAQQLLLAAFIPAIVYMADAVGTQTQTIFIRSLAISHQLDLKKYIWRELRVTVSLAILLGLASELFIFLWFGASPLGPILGLSIAVTVLAAALIALGLPWILQRFNFDPAIASGPFATVVRDIMSLLIYFGIALLLL